MSGTSDDGVQFDSELMALARLRRMLLELGVQIGLHDSNATAGLLQAWMAAPREDLGGLTPLAALQTPEGTEMVRSCLQELAFASLDPSEISPDAPADDMDPPTATASAEAFYQGLRNRPGSVGYDDTGRLLRRRPDGTDEVME